MKTILQIIVRLLRTNAFCTKRDIYYQNVGLFVTQRRVDDLIDDIASSFGVSRSDLNIVGSTKGSIVGPITINLKNGTHIDCSVNPMDIPDASAINSIALQFNPSVLVVEKDSVFVSLVEAGFLSRFPGCVLITGKGQPDVPTRHLLKRIESQIYTELLFMNEFCQTQSKASVAPRIYILCDSDAYGFAIFATYKFGSRSLAHEDIACKSAMLLHFQAADFQNDAQLDAQCMMLTFRERKMILANLNSPHLLCYKALLQKLLFYGKKCEIQIIPIDYLMKWLVTIIVDPKSRLSQISDPLQK